MNKQEAKDYVEENACEGYFENQVVMPKEEILALLEQIDEPQKPVVPKFVADLYESIKDDFEDKVYHLCLQFDRDNGELSSEVWGWFDCGKNEPIQTLVKMKLYGYEIEQEKLYTVEIPDPNSIWKYTFLTNRGPGVSIDRTDDDFWKDDSKNQLTEAEIRKDFDFLWQSAKEVE